MIYPNTIESKLGFDIVREQISSNCLSAAGKEFCSKMAFENRTNIIAKMLEETNEMAKIIASDTGFPLNAVYDMDHVLSILNVEGSFITAKEMLRLRTSLETLAAIATFFSKQRIDESSTPYPRLDLIASEIKTIPTVIAEISRVIDQWGNVRDNASAELSAIRSSLSAMNGSINSIMRRVVAKAVNNGIIEADTKPTVRDGRLVIPVAPMNKRKIAGIVHDESASGKTVFIEPTEIVEANNKLRELEFEERREIKRILLKLTDYLRPYASDLHSNCLIIGQFDFIHAKAAFAIENGCALPKIAENANSIWKEAFHPVLLQSLKKQGKTIVPLNVDFTTKNRIVVISGPNAGGKSVALKTVGIVQYMAQCGVLPSLSADSKLSIFQSVFVDIGDDQSIEDDLSTYSSHLRHMKTFLAKGNDKSMILIDEFGAGTEPQIGGAIAQAFLKRFAAKGMWGVVTTHFQNLKLMAEETSGLINGSMLYDRQVMKPLFRLSVGSPGSSFAIEIARKTGVPNDVISDAEALVGSDYVNADKYLLDINRDKRYWENKRDSVKAKEKTLNELLEKYEAEAALLHQKRNDIIAEARKEAAQIIEGSNAAVEKTIRDIKQSQADKEKTQSSRQELAQFHRQLKNTATVSTTNDLLAKVHKSKTFNKRPKNKVDFTANEHDTQAILVGDNVLLEGSDTVGKVIEINGKDATVIFGHLTTTTKLSRLKATNRKADSGVKKAASFVSVETRNEMRERQLHFKPDIDIRGFRVDEALQAVTYFIDDAVQFNSQRVRILHGTGTGALRQTVRDYLQSVQSVRAFHDEDVRLGGAGITVVEF